IMSADASQSLFDRIRQWPRSMQWAVLALLAIGLFLLWDTYLRKFQEDIARAADSIETQAGEIRRASDVVRSLQNNREVVEGLGAVAKPKDAAKGTRELQDTINEILKKHPISGQELDLRTKGKLPPGTLTSVTSRRLD